MNPILISCVHLFDTLATPELSCQFSAFFCSMSFTFDMFVVFFDDCAIRLPYVHESVLEFLDIGQNTIA